MKILGLDFETTGLDIKKDKITEVGAVLWDTEKQVPLQTSSYFVDWGLTELDLMVVKKTGITLEMLKAYGVKPVEALAVLLKLVQNSDGVICAHNGNNFDKHVFAEFCKSQNQAVPEVLWIDTLSDIEYSDDIQTRKLTWLAAEHGFVNPFAHRAIFDVLTMLKVLQCYPIERTVELAKQPTVMLQAMVSFADKDKAKARGYMWDSNSRTWRKAFKQSLVDNEKASCGFPTQVIR